MQSSLIFVQTSVDQTDEHLAAQSKAVLEHARCHRSFAVLGVLGYDRDPRELWEIPEVRTHLRRLVGFGVIAVLVRSTGIRELVPTDLIGCPALGAFEAWAHGHELLNTGRNKVPQSLVSTFLGTVLPAAAASLRRNLERFARVPSNPDLVIEVKP